MQLIRLSILVFGLSISTLAYAIAPVVDAYNDSDNDLPSESQKADPPKVENPKQPESPKKETRPETVNNPPSFSVNQRITILERQISNLNPLLVQIDDLNQQLQGLRGKLEEQQHHLKLLEDQIRSQYQELEKRLTTRGGTLPPAAGLGTGMAPQNPSNVPLVKSNTPAVPAGTSTPESERAYQAAFQLLKNKQYAPAIEAFEAFVKKYPTDLHIPNVHYFLGQLYLLQGQPEQSIARFNYFINSYPQDARVPDALLQLGLAYFAKGDKDTAITTFKKIIQQYPDSKAAQSAQARLQQFQAMISSANLAEKNKG
jgi:tol-pal system protein YbgF